MPEGCVVPAGLRIEPAATGMGVGPVDFLPFGQTDCLPELLGLGNSVDRGVGRGGKSHTCHIQPPPRPLPSCRRTSSPTDRLPNLHHAEMVSGISNGSAIPQRYNSDTRPVVRDRRKASPGSRSSMPYVIQQVHQGLRQELLCAEHLACTQQGDMDITGTVEKTEHTQDRGARPSSPRGAQPLTPASLCLTTLDTGLFLEVQPGHT